MFRLILNRMTIDATTDVAEVLGSRGIQASAHRVAVARYVLATNEHPSADQVLARVRSGFPQISRATVYNTLNLLVEKGLLRELFLAEGKVVFDPKTDSHHHLIDDITGAIHDIPWESIQVSKMENLDSYEIRDYQVVLRGKPKLDVP
ncbi:MAG TPA: transcriptional repressor [Blastocatellia bacterium]|nr:transcriptional repressor [Blastocatellia bacterium]